MLNDAPLSESDAALKRAQAALRAIASTANHDLNAPVRHIQVFFELLERDHGAALGEDGRAYFGHIQSAAGRLSGLIERLVDYARVVSAPVAKERLNLTRIAEDAALDVDADIHVAPLPEAFGDGGQIARVFAELIKNAVEHAPGAAIEVTGRPAGDGGAEIRVADTGPGIDPNYSDAVFEFLSRPPAADPQTPGGAGLAVCRHIIESHGGVIRLDMEAEGGATFVFTLPPAPQGGG